MSCPHPAEMAVFIKVPAPAAAFYNFHAPMVVVRRDCDEKCECSRHRYAAKHSNQEYADEFKILHLLCNRRSPLHRPWHLRFSSSGSRKSSADESASLSVRQTAHSAVATTERSLPIYLYRFVLIRGYRQGCFDSRISGRIVVPITFESHGCVATGRVNCQEQALQNRNGFRTLVRSATSGFCKLFDQENGADYLLRGERH